MKSRTMRRGECVKLKWLRDLLLITFLSISILKNIYFSFDNRFHLSLLPASISHPAAPLSLQTLESREGDLKCFGGENQKKTRSEGKIEKVFASSVGVAFVI